MAGFNHLKTGAEISAAAGMAPSPHQSGAKNGKGSIWLGRWSSLEGSFE
ncbi:transposase [Deinococcus rubellus]